MRHGVLLTCMSCLLAAAGFLISEAANAQTDGASRPTPMLREPTMSASDIAFVYADDIWIAPRHGGTARRLVARPGAKTTPRFSPDGHSLAFAGNLDGQEAIY